MFVLKIFRQFFLLLLGVIALVSSLSGQDIHTCTIISSGAAVRQPSGAPTGLPDGIVQKAVSYKPTTSPRLGGNWRNGSTITVRFIGGSTALRDRVMRYARQWTEHANLDFRVVSGGRADIRVAFTQNGGSWSMVGSSSAYADQNRPSMNFGWLTDRTPDYEVKRTVLHEFGHALGLLHEHQNPAGGIPWDEEAVYRHYARTQGWDRRTIYHNVMATAAHDATQYSAYDRASIMHYPVDARLTGGRYSVGMNNELSATDRNYIARMYPGRAASTPTTTSRPAPRPRPTTTTISRPTRPARQLHAVSISNALGQDQYAETVELYIAGRKHLIRLDRNGRTRQQLNLRLPRGEHPYKVVTRSTYQGYRNVRVNGRVQRRRVQRQIPGQGAGTLVVDGTEQLTLYGSYDRERRRMNVYLGASK